MMKVVLFLLLFIVVVFLLLLTPPVQNFAAGKIAGYLKKKLHTEVRIASLRIVLPNRVVLKDVYLEDQTKDTLLAGGVIRADISLFKLINNEVEVKEIEFENVTAKVKRVLPDTVFNFTFIADAFATEQTKKADTAQTAPLKLAVHHLKLTNFRTIYRDVITGNDMTLRVNKLDAIIDTLNPYIQQYSIPSLTVSGLTARFNQTTPLVVADTTASTPATPIAFKLAFDKVNLNQVLFEYNNDPSAMFTNFSIGDLVLDGKAFDMQNRVLHLSQLKLDETNSTIHFGKKQAEVAAKKVGEKVVAEANNSWHIQIDDLQVNNNGLAFDNDNQPQQRYGIDYAHMHATDLTLHAQNVIFNTDTIGGLITQGSFKEKSGFQLDQLEGDLLYAAKETHVRNLLLKTPGTELKRDLVLRYNSFDDLSKHFEKTQMSVNIDNSHIQVKDILAFAPQLRSQKAFANPNAVWYLNAKANGNLDQMNITALQFRGLSNTIIDASGTVASVSNPNAAGGRLNIRRLHTTQTDLALFTGQRLSTPDMRIPEVFDASGTIAGNMNRFNADMDIATSAGSVAIDGQFANLVNPAKASYNARIRTTSLQLGYILKQSDLGGLSANVSVNGTGFTPQSMNAKFNGVVYSANYNKYTYRNVALNGSLRGNNFAVNVDSKDPNADLTLSANGNFSSHPSIHVNGFVDSLKAHKLNFASQPLTFRGKIDGDFPSLNPDYLEGRLYITQGLLVSGTSRVPLDTVSLLAGRSDTGQYIRLFSPIATAQLTGQYRFADLGNIFQNNINPYFTVSNSYKVRNVQPYRIYFTADVQNHPIFSSLVDGLSIDEPVHIDASLATGQGLQGNIRSDQITFSNNQINGLDVRIASSPTGLQITGNTAQILSGNMHLYNATVNASIMNNVIDFNTRIADRGGKDKYLLAGILQQPRTGTFQLQLKPDSLMLNYDRWTIAPNNSLTYDGKTILANNFSLSSGNQQLTLQSGAGSPPPLNVTFNNFQISTITGIMKQDTLLANGLVNGTVTFPNILQQPLFTSKLSINDLSLRQDTVGNVLLSVSSHAAKSYDVDATITGRGNDLRLNGTIAPQGGSDVGMDLNADIRSLRLQTLQGALGSFLTNVSGGVNGNVSLKGTFANPDVKGRVNFDTTSFAVKVLGSQFTIDKETLDLNSNGFHFDNFTVKDSAGNTLNVNGDVHMQSFSNLAFDLNVKATNFMALNSTKRQNSVYYGRLVVSSDLNIGGTQTYPVVDGTVSVEEGTNFFAVLPQQDPGVAQREGIVQFVDMSNPASDSLFLSQYDSLNVSSLLGYDIAANIEIKRDAILNLVIDAANGDFVNVKGEGLLSAGIDPSGKITLTGNYTLQEGAYQITFNFLQRRFEIQRGSTITWLGEPTAAQLDVTAVYTANTSPLDLVKDQITGASNAVRNTYLQKLPFQVLLKLQGELMKPTITFDIALPPDQNYGVSKSIVNDVDVRLQQLRQDQGEINKQVFSLLLLGRFVSENPFESSGSGFNAANYARQSVSKLLTEQLNKLASNLINGVDINFDVTSTEDYTTGELRNRTDLNVALSKRLLNDRLQVTVGNNFELEGPRKAQGANNNAFGGNIAVNYQLSQDGKYLLRVYRRNEYEGVVDGYVIETGLGFTITLDYDRFADILKRKKARVENRDDQQNKDQ
jgi:hypothetical protein